MLIFAFFFCRDLSYNQLYSLSEIPEAKLRQMKTLDLSHNRLTMITPNVIQGAKKLSHLYVLFVIR